MKKLLLVFTCWFTTLLSFGETSTIKSPEEEGVNIVPLFDPNQTNPTVNISLKNLSLDRTLQFVTKQVNFTFEVGADAVTVSPKK